MNLSERERGMTRASTNRIWTFAPGCTQLLVALDRCPSSGQSQRFRFCLVFPGPFSSYATQLHIYLQCTDWNLPAGFLLAFYKTCSPAAWPATETSNIAQHHHSQLYKFTCEQKASWRAPNLPRTDLQVGKHREWNFVPNAFHTRILFRKKPSCRCLCPAQSRANF